MKKQLVKSIIISPIECLNLYSLMIVLFKLYTYKKPKYIFEHSLISKYAVIFDDYYHRIFKKT